MEYPKLISHGLHNDNNNIELILKPLYLKYFYMPEIDEKPDLSPTEWKFELTSLDEFKKDPLVPLLIHKALKVRERKVRYYESAISRVRHILNLIDDH